MEMDFSIETSILDWDFQDLDSLRHSWLEFHGDERLSAANKDQFR